MQPFCCQLVNNLLKTKIILLSQPIWGGLPNQLPQNPATAAFLSSFNCGLGLEKRGEI